MTDPDLDKVVETIKRNVPDESACRTNPSRKEINNTVTMNQPLEPWGHTAFHKFLAIHIHNATRLAGDTDGIVDDVLVAQKWDLPRVVE